MEATSLLSCCFSWVWFGMPKVLWTNKSPISLERVVWFCWFLQVVICILLDIYIEVTKICYFGLALSGITSQPIRLSDVLNWRNSKTIWGSYQVDFLLPLKLEEICYFDLWPQNTLGQSVCRIFCFWLVLLVKLNTEEPLLHCTCSFFSSSDMQKFRHLLECYAIITIKSSLHSFLSALRFSNLICRSKVWYK